MKSRVIITTIFIVFELLVPTFVFYAISMLKKREKKLGSLLLIEGTDEIQRSINEEYRSIFFFQKRADGELIDEFEGLKGMLSFSMFFFPALTLLLLTQSILSIKDLLGLIESSDVTFYRFVLKSVPPWCFIWVLFFTLRMRVITKRTIASIEILLRKL